MAIFRIRCGSCESNFCSSCRSKPYHVGFTCEQKVAFENAVKCRFCGEAIEERKGDEDNVFRDVCEKAECRSQIDASCEKKHPCGHICHGFKGETKCLPCLDPECVTANPDATLGEDSGSFCSICFISGIGDSPSIQLGCKHIFHVDCLMTKI